MNPEASPQSPLSAAESYRREMFRLAGEADPSEAMSGMPMALRELVVDAGEHLRARPAEGEWSALELVGHMLDAEVVVGSRLRQILAEDRPQLAGFDQDAWVRAQRHNEADPEALLEALTALRPLTVSLYRGLSEGNRDRVGIHAERGPESLRTVYRMLAGHDIFHLNQVRETVANARGG
ncbi:MAG: DinB family protein [Candidatus Dormibacteraeota bacterium]|nr:DinB family protein [Candidatus Dormibacteraeota bacterium]